MTKFQLGNRVTRPVDVYGDHSEKLHGRVVRVYSAMNTQFGDYPELYEVQWDGIERNKKGYLPHGLELE